MHEAYELLEEFDSINARLRVLKPQLERAATDYGRSIGVWGFRIEHLRINRDIAKKVG